MTNRAPSHAFTLVKVGGNVLDSETDLQEFVNQFARLAGRKVLVHGGGKLATQLSQRLGLTPKMIDGRRVTDAATLDLVVQVYGGLINKKVVAMLQAQGCTSVGVTGVDANCILARKRSLKNGIDYGFVGDVVSVQAEAFESWAERGWVPVVAPITHDGQGQLLNTNADTLAHEIAAALAERGHEVQLIFTFEKPGVLLDAADDSTVLPTLDAAQIAALREQGKIHSGMIPKLENACEAIQRGVKSVVLGKATDLSRLMQGTGGTKIS